MAPILPIRPARTPHEQPARPQAMVLPARTLSSLDGVQHYKTLWLSDLHLGTPGCKAEFLLDFLRHTEAETLYLVGDIIDGWQLKKNWYWPQAHNDVVQKMLRKARKGTRVVFIPGNHDAFARQFFDDNHPMRVGAIDVADEAIHTLACGRKLWVTHGDLFDGVMQHAKWLAYLGDSLYTFVLVLNHHYNRLRAKFGLSYWSLSQYLKHKVKNAVGFITQFEDVLAHEAQRRGFDGVVCGHIHKAEIRNIDGLLYCNDGDWVESLTALAETTTGELQLLTWQPYPTEPVSHPKRSATLAQPPVTDTVMARARL